MDYIDAARMVMDSAVVIYTRTEQGGLYVSSGVLVSVEERELILTAGHNLEGCRRTSDILPYFTGYDSFVHVSSWGTSVYRYSRSDEPDVAWIELDMGEKTRWGRMKALPLCAVSRTTAPGQDGHLILLGFPLEYTKSLKDMPGTHLKTTGFCGKVLPSDSRSPHDTAGRGLNVSFHGEAVEVGTNQMVPLPDPLGISGGPLFFVSDKGVELTGLARAKHGNPTVEWCEPAYEAVRLLQSHPDAEISGAARKRIAELGVLETISEPGLNPTMPALPEPPWLVLFFLTRSGSESNPSCLLHALAPREAARSSPSRSHRHPFYAQDGHPLERSAA